MKTQTDRDVVIVEGLRTPFVKSGSKLAKIHPAELGRVALRELIAKLHLDTSCIDEVIIGNVGNPVDTVNISRVVALKAGVPQKVSAYTVHRNCASALESVSQGFDKIRSGMADVVVAGGTENMSQMPVLLPEKFQDLFGKLFSARGPREALPILATLFHYNLKQITALLLNKQKDDFFPIISVMKGLTDPFVGLNMGQTAEILAKEWSISRLDQDEFALRSHQLALKAQSQGFLQEEIAPVALLPKLEEFVSQDLGPRVNQTLENLQKLKPFFDKKSGTVTAGNACPITDGAAMLLLMSRQKARELGYKPVAQIRSYAFAGLEPERMGFGPCLCHSLSFKKKWFRI
jgi:acetyl-CoA acyltransferase